MPAYLYALYCIQYCTEYTLQLVSHPNKGGREEKDKVYLGM